MTRDEVVDLLTMTAAYDLRTLGEFDVSAWHAVADAQGWTFATARRALVEHYAAYTERIMPGHITQRINAVRRVLRTQLDGLDVRAPDAFRDDPRAETRYIRAAQQQFIERGMDEWSAGQREVPMAEALEQ